MTGRGRARGRGRSILDVELSSPGGLSSRANSEPHEQKNDTDKSVNSVDKEDANTDGQKRPLSKEDMKAILDDTRTYSSQYDVRSIVMCVRSFLRSGEDLKLVAQTIYDKCLSDASLAKQGAEICEKLSSVSYEEVMFRGVLLGKVQEDYKNREDLLQHDPQRFTCFLAFLCEIFGVMRTTNNEVFKPLVGPICDCMDMSLGRNPLFNEEDEERGKEEVKNEDLCDVLNQELQSIGRLLDEHSPQRLKGIMEAIRTCIINGSTSTRARCALLEVFELYIREWQPLVSEVTQYYCDMAVDIISGIIL